MSDTPRTDEQQFRRGSMGPVAKHRELVVPAEFARTLERELATERAAREAAENELKAVAAENHRLCAEIQLLTAPHEVGGGPCNAMKQRAEAAEAKLAECLEYIEHRKKKFEPQRALTTCEHGEQNWLCHLSSTEPPALLKEVCLLRAEVAAHREGKFDDSWRRQCEDNWRLEEECAALKIEYESRALWIAEMNAILGYDNSDGFHSTPSPHEIAKQLVQERDGLREGFDALVKGTIAAKEKSNKELQVSVEAVWREGLERGHTPQDFAMKDIYSMTVPELLEEKRRYENFIREIKRFIRIRLKTSPNEECGS